MRVQVPQWVLYLVGRNDTCKRVYAVLRLNLHKIYAVRVGKEQKPVRHNHILIMARSGIL